MPRTPRRKFLELSAATAASLAAPASLRAAVPTPEATEGPFYPNRSMRFEDIDNDLVKIAGLVKQAGGEIFLLKGRVLDRDGEPVSNARVEIWQVDMNARYLHTGDRGGKPRDKAFQGFGHDITNAQGQYQFRTIKPVAYPGRTPHIHVKVFAKGKALTTQFYIANEPENTRDFLFEEMSSREQQAVLMEFVQGGDGEEATVDIIL